MLILYRNLKTTKEKKIKKKNQENIFSLHEKHKKMFRKYQNATKTRKLLPYLTSEILIKINSCLPKE